MFVYSIFFRAYLSRLVVPLLQEGLTKMFIQKPKVSYCSIGPGESIMVLEFRELLKMHVMYII